LIFLFEQVHPRLKKIDTNMRDAIAPDLKLALTLHHLAEGTTHSTLSSNFRVGRSTVSEIIYDTCKAIYDVLQPIYMKPPSSPAEWKAVAEGYAVLIVLIISLFHYNW
jgi:hypothetical protein